MISDDILYLPAAELGARIRDRKLSPVELTEAYLARAARLGPRLSAFATLMPERARAEAHQAERELASGRWRGPLHGVPYAAKDLLSARGAPTTWGARPFAHRVLDEDAAVVRRLADAGAILLGKAAMVELAGSFGYRSGAASLTGPARNPWRTTQWTCGSSSGSGAIVAAALAGFAIGSETWGSIVCPSAFCGVSGLRPTYGRVSLRGAMSLSYSLDKLGPMARDAGDCALVLAAIADPAGDTPAPVRRPLRIGWVEAQSRGAARPNAVVFARAREALGELGSLSTATLPDGPWAAATLVVLMAEGASSFQPLITSGRILELADPEMPINAHVAAELPAADYLRALRIRTRLERALEADVWSRFDLLAGPSLGTTAVGATADLDALPDDPDPLGAIGNLAGLPALSLPVGFVAGLPLGVQLVGPPFAEATLVDVARRYQARTEWHRRRPPL